VYESAVKWQAGKGEKSERGNGGIKPVDGRVGKPLSGAQQKRGYRSGWWRATHGPATPEHCAGRRLHRADGWQNYGAGCAASARR